MGHEISHGFDSKGRAFDADGRLRTWWSADTARAFEERAQCFERQYGQWRHEQVGALVNGRLTLGENIADNAGIRAAFIALRRHLLASPQVVSVGAERLSLEQQFFVGYAYSWCAKWRDEALVSYMESNVHSPPAARFAVFSMTFTNLGDKISRRIVRFRNKTNLFQCVQETRFNTQGSVDVEQL